MTLGRLTFHVAPAGRDLEQFAVERRPVLADEDDLAGAFVDRHHDHGSGVVDEVSFEALAAGRLEGPRGHVEQKLP